MEIKTVHHIIRYTLLYSILLPVFFISCNSGGNSPKNFFGVPIPSNSISARPTINDAALQELKRAFVYEDSDENLSTTSTIDFQLVDPSKEYVIVAENFAIEGNKSTISQGDSLKIKVTITADSNYWSIPIQFFLVKKGPFEALPALPYLGSDSIYTFDGIDVTLALREFYDLNTIATAPIGISQVFTGTHEYTLDVKVPISSDAEAIGEYYMFLLLDPNMIIGRSLEELEPTEDLVYQSDASGNPLFDENGQKILDEPATQTKKNERLANTERSILINPGLFKAITVTNSNANKQDLAIRKLTLSSDVMVLPIITERMTEMTQKQLLKGTLIVDSVNKAVGGCSSSEYQTQTACEDRGKTWIPGPDIRFEIRHNNISNFAITMPGPTLGADEKSGIPFILEIGLDIQEQLKTLLTDGSGNFELVATLDPDGKFSSTEMNGDNNFFFLPLTIVDDAVIVAQEAIFEQAMQKTIEESGTAYQGEAYLKISSRSGQFKMEKTRSDEEDDLNMYESYAYHEEFKAFELGAIADFFMGSGFRDGGGDYDIHGSLEAFIFGSTYTVAEAVAYAGFYPLEILASNAEEDEDEEPQKEYWLGDDDNEENGADPNSPEEEEMSVDDLKEKTIKTGIDVHLIYLNKVIYQYRQYLEFEYEHSISKEVKRGAEWVFFGIVKVEAGIRAEIGLAGTLGLSQFSKEFVLAGEIGPSFSIGGYAGVSLDLLLWKGGILGVVEFIAMGLPFSSEVRIDLENFNMMKGGVIGIDIGGELRFQVFGPNGYIEVYQEYFCMRSEYCRDTAYITKFGKESPVYEKLIFDFADHFDISSRGPDGTNLHGADIINAEPKPAPVDYLKGYAVMNEGTATFLNIGYKSSLEVMLIEESPDKKEKNTSWGFKPVNEMYVHIRDASNSSDRQSCMMVEGEGTSDANVRFAPYCGNEKNRHFQWRLMRMQGDRQYMIINRHTMQCLGLISAEWRDREVVMKPCDFTMNDPFQLWQIVNLVQKKLDGDKPIYLKNRRDGFYLTLRDTLLYDWAELQLTDNRAEAQPVNIKRYRGYYVFSMKTITDGYITYSGDKVVYRLRPYWDQAIVDSDNGIDFGAISSTLWFFLEVDYPEQKDPWGHTTQEAMRGINIINKYDGNCLSVRDTSDDSWRPDPKPATTYFIKEPCRNKPEMLWDFDEIE